MQPCHVGLCLISYAAALINIFMHSAWRGLVQLQGNCQQSEMPSETGWEPQAFKC